MAPAVAPVMAVTYPIPKPKRKPEPRLTNELHHNPSSGFGLNDARIQTLETEAAR